MKQDAKKNPNRKQRAQRIQLNVNQSSVFETRKIPHTAKVSKEVFVKGFEDASADWRLRRHMAQHHLLPKDFSLFLGNKTWPTLDENKLRRRAAAWRWVVTLATAPEQPSHQKENILAALFSRLLLQKQIIKKVGSDTIYASLGNYSWAAMVMPLAVETDGNTTVSLFPPTLPQGMCSGSMSPTRINGK